MKEWNVVVTVVEKCFNEGYALLSNYGYVEKTPFHNVLTLEVMDTKAFFDSFHQDARRNLSYQHMFSRVMPCTKCFSFQTVEGFEEKAKQNLKSFLPQLANQSFHVRMHRRGFYHKINSQEEAGLLGYYLEQELQLLGTLGKVTFDNPDMILAVEIVAQRAGLSLWSRGQRKHYPFLKLN